MYTIDPYYTALPGSPVSYAYYGRHPVLRIPIIRYRVVCGTIGPVAAFPLRQAAAGGRCAERHSMMVVGIVIKCVVVFMITRVKCEWV